MTLAIALSLLLAGAPRSAVPRPAAQRAPPPSPLACALLTAVSQARLEGLVDAGPAEGCPGSVSCPMILPRVAAAPHLDLAVIRLASDGRALDAAEVIVDPDSPGGRIVPLDRNLAPRGLRLRRWNLERREAGDAAPPFTDDDDVVPDGPRAGRDFMEPYPASLFKLLVAFHVARRSAAGALSLDERVPETRAPDAAVRTVRAWLDRMMTVSDNGATRVLLAWLHRRDEVARMNRDLAALGLRSLRVDGTNPEDGSRWAPGEVHAGAVDVARLLWLVAGGPRVGWRTPAGRRVTSADLPGRARALLQGLLADQANHDVLSSGSVCGGRPPGIPALVPERWIDPATGAEGAINAAWRRDVRPCNAAAQVRFLHKTGLTWNYASDAGIVESLPGRPSRRYVVALVASTGTRYLDPEHDSDAVHPCAAEGLCVSRRLAAIGEAIDRFMVGASASRRNRAGCAPSTP